MINAMSTIIGRLPPKCVDEDPGKVTRTLGVFGHIEDSYSHQTTANDSIIEVCLLIGRTKKHLKFAHEKIRKSKKKASRDHQGGSKF